MLMPKNPVPKATQKARVRVLMISSVSRVCCRWCHRAESMDDQAEKRCSSGHKTIAMRSQKVNLEKREIGVTVI